MPIVRTKDKKFLKYPRTAPGIELAVITIKKEDGKLVGPMAEGKQNLRTARRERRMEMRKIEKQKGNPRDKGYPKVRTK